MQTKMKEEIGRAVSAIAKMGKDYVSYLAPNGRGIMECIKTPLGFLFVHDDFRGEKFEITPAGGCVFFSVFPNGQVTTSPIPFDGTGAKDPQRSLGEIEIDFSSTPPTWRLVDETDFAR